MNVALANRLGLRNIRPEEAFGEDCVLYSGELPEPMEPEKFALHVKGRLSAGALKLLPGDGMVKRVFMCSGAGGEFAPYAAMRGGDAYLTGEMKHHEALEARKTGLTCVVAGHYETERVFAEYLAAYLKKRAPDTGFLVSRAESAPFTTV